MDTALPKNVIAAKRNKNIAILVLVVVAIIGAIYFMRSGLKSSIELSEIRTAYIL